MALESDFMSAKQTGSSVQPEGAQDRSETFISAPAQHGESSDGRPTDVVADSAGVAASTVAVGLYTHRSSMLFPSRTRELAAQQQETAI